LEERPSNAYGLFEQISSEVKTVRKGGAEDVPAKPNANVEWAKAMAVSYPPGARRSGSAMLPRVARRSASPQQPPRGQLLSNPLLNPFLLSQALTAPAGEPADGEEAAAAVRDIDGEALRITNFVQEAQMFDAAGVGAGLTRMNAIYLFAGMRKLANAEPVKSVRLFGKILGLK